MYQSFNTNKDSCLTLNSGSKATLELQKENENRHPKTGLKKIKCKSNCAYNYQLQKKSDFILEGPGSDEVSRDESTISKPEALTPVKFS